MSFKKEITEYLQNQGAYFVRFIDVSDLLREQNQGLPRAVLFGILLTPPYIKEVMETPDYVQARVKNNFDFDDDQYYLSELRTGKLSDELAAYLTQKGYSAYSQSDENQVESGVFDGVYGKTPLPHKTIAVKAGLGWIGKHNLLVNTEYGSAFCIGVVLTNVPFETNEWEPVLSRCGNCTYCMEICETKALKGHRWDNETKREDMIDISKCTTCIKCLIHCPWTQKYMKKGINDK